MSSDTTLKPQPTLKGYYAWVISKVVEVDGKTAAEITARIIEDWVDSRSEMLAQEYAASRKVFTKSQVRPTSDEGGSVLRHPGSRRREDNVQDSVLDTDHQ
jgi:hypothetical protein